MRNYIKELWRNFGNDQLPKVEAWCIATWASVIFLVFLSASLRYSASENTFVSSFFMSLAFSFFGGVIVASIVNWLGEIRERNRWARYDSLVQKHLNISQYRALDAIRRYAVEPTYTELGFDPPVLPWDAEKFDTDEQIRSRVREMFKDCQTAYPNSLGANAVKQAINISGELARLDSIMSFLANSPFTPQDLLSKTLTLHAYIGELNLWLADPNLNTELRAKAVAKALVGVAECVWDGYEVTLKL